jgi:histidine triad (HIT) family protein
MNCIFCDFANAKKECFKVWEDEHFFAFLDINPINPGHTLLIPKEHVADVFEMSPNEYKDIFEAAQYLSFKLKKVFNAPKVGLAIEGFGIDHAHIHIVPVHNGNDLNPERAKPMTGEELKKIQEKIIAS